MISFERKMELEGQLKEAGNNLLNPPSSIDELLFLLDKVENLLISVEQAPPRSMQKALLPLMKALISDALLRHSDMDVKVSVASCITEITRITAPDAPYNDERMKEIFQLTVAAFENLSHVSSRCYTKAVSILDTVARVRLCLLMLDLDCDELIIEMFQQFLKKIRSNHPNTVFLAMESIMTLVLDESEDISWGLLSPLLASVRKENQKILPTSWKLGENVIANCAYKIKPYLMEAVQSMDIALDEYSPIIASICKSESDALNKSGDHLVTVGPVFRGELCQAVDAISKSLMRNVTAGTRENNRINNGILNIKPSKILEHSHVEVPRGADAPGGAGPDNFVSLYPVKSETEPDTMPAPQLKDEKVTESEMSCQINEIIGASSASPNGGLPGGRHRRRGQSKGKESMTTENADPNSSLANRLEFKTQIVDKLTRPTDASLKMKSEDKTSERKRPKRSRRVEIDAKPIQAPPYFVPEKEARVRSDLEEKKLLQATLKKYINKRTLDDDAMLDESITGASGNQKMNSRPVTTARKGGAYLEKTPKTNPKGQRNAGKEMASELPDLGEELIGRRIKVWWPMDKTFYEGVVASYDSITMKHRVLYEDGDEERLNLRRQRWQLIHDKGQEIDLPKPDVSLDILPKLKGKTHSSSPKSAKRRSSFKRNGVHASTATRKSKSYGGISPDGGMLEKPSVHESVKDASTTMTDSRSSGDGQKFADELKAESNSMESKPTIAEMLPSSDGTSLKDGESLSA
ncbi:Chloroplast-like protein isoform 2, partial [Theobroma cacao]